MELSLKVRSGNLPEGLSLHDSLHIGGPSELGGHQGAGRGRKSGAERALFNLVSEDLLDELAGAFEGYLLLLTLLLLLLVVLEVEAFLGAVSELLFIIVLELLDDVLVNGVNHVEDFVSSLLEALDEGTVGDGTSALAGDVVDLLLVLFHTFDVFLEGDEVITALGSVESEELGELGSVGLVLVDSELQVLGELLVEGLVVLGVLGDLSDHLDALSGDVLLDHLQESVVLELFTGDVEGEVLGVDNSSDEGQPLGDELVGGVHDENSSDVELEVALLLLLLEEVEGGSLGHEEKGLELNLAFNGHLLDGKVVLPVVGETLVEGGILLGGHVLGLSGPDRLVLVESLVLVRNFLDLLGLLDLLGTLVFLDLGLGIVSLSLLSLLAFLLLGVDFGGLFLVVLIVGDLLLGGLFDEEFDIEGDELGVGLNQILQLLFLEEFFVVGLELENDAGSSLEVLMVDSLGNGESSTGVGLPSPDLVTVHRFGDDGNLLGDEEGRVESYSELTDHRDVSSAGKGLHEGLGAGTGDDSEIVDHFLLGHTDTGIVEGKGVVALVRDDSDLEVGLDIDASGLGVGDRLVSDLVQSVGGIGDQFSEEDVLVRVEGVDDQSHQLLDISVERVYFLLRVFGHFNCAKRLSPQLNTGLIVLELFGKSQTLIISPNFGLI